MFFTARAFFLVLVLALGAGRIGGPVRGRSVRSRAGLFDRELDGVFRSGIFWRSVFCGRRSLCFTLRELVEHSGCGAGADVLWLRLDHRSQLGSAPW